VARTLEIQDLKASIGEKPILQGIDLAVRTGEIHALMGPNGSGKSTLANVLLGHPAYRVTGGRVLLDGEDFLAMTTDERSRRGVFLAFQYPVEIPGITVGKFLKRALETRMSTGTQSQGGQERAPETRAAAGDGSKAPAPAGPVRAPAGPVRAPAGPVRAPAGPVRAGGAAGAGMNVTAFIRELRQAMDFMEMDQDFINRYLNQGFSGGEKKRMEILQMLMLAPAFAVLDETDSGLDIDALKVVARGVNRMRGEGFGALIITHYQRILNYIKPDYVHIMVRGRIVTSGGSDLVGVLEEHGYEWVRKEYGIEEEGRPEPALEGTARSRSHGGDG
jgi:Fe-S cluster assembly ATP-binding protein